MWCRWSSSSDSEPKLLDSHHMQRRLSLNHIVMTTSLLCLILHPPDRNQSYLNLQSSQIHRLDRLEQNFRSKEKEHFHNLYFSSKKLIWNVFFSCFQIVFWFWLEEWRQDRVWPDSNRKVTLKNNFFGDITNIRSWFFKNGLDVNFLN